MRALATMLLVSLISPIAVSQTAELETPAVAATKPAWEWTLDERIAKRLDPAMIRERTQASERDRVEKDGFTPEVRASVGLLATPVRFIVEGRRDPELLMPFDEIRESGWQEELFWQTLQEATAEYVKAQEERVAMELKALTLPPAERRALSIKAEARNTAECGLRMDALQKVRQKLGTEKFDRFLYEKVAPNVGISSDFPFGNEEWRLRYIEGGCR
jgi:hypothetical protein